MPLVFEVVFSTSAITQIESIGGGRVEGGWGGWWGRVGSHRRGKANIQTQSGPDRHCSQGRPGLPSESVWHPMRSY